MAPKLTSLNISNDSEGPTTWAFACGACALGATQSSVSEGVPVEGALPPQRPTLLDGSLEWRYVRAELLLRCLWHIVIVAFMYRAGCSPMLERGKVHATAHGICHGELQVHSYPVVCTMADAT